MSWKSIEMCKWRYMGGWQPALLILLCTINALSWTFELGVGLPNAFLDQLKWGDWHPLNNAWAEPPPVLMFVKKHYVHWTGQWRLAATSSHMPTPCISQICKNNYGFLNWCLEIFVIKWGLLRIWLHIHGLVGSWSGFCQSELTNCL